MQVDVAILGGGPAGYPAAIRLAQNGKKVVIVEQSELGGTCLNRGCIPTKSLLAGTNLLEACQHADSFGVEIGSVSWDWSKMISRKNSVVARLRSGLQSVIASHGIEVIHGTGVITAPNTIDTGNVQITAGHIIVATGSEPKELSSIPFDGEIVHSSTSILDLQKLPESIIVIGAGAIGCEFASIFASLGCRVTLLEALPRILSTECSSVAEYLAKAFKKQGIDIRTSCMMTSSKRTEKGIELTLQNGEKLHASIALVAVGRVLNTDKIGLSSLNVKVEKGAVVVDEHMRTNVPNVWAIGDVTGKFLYAHVATHEGLVAAENILGNTTCMRYDAVPGVIFTKPEIGSVGLSLDAAKAQGFKAAAYRFPIEALGRGQASISEGFYQLVIEDDTGRILGAQAVGDHAGEAIAEVTVAIANELTVECLVETIHSHPTFSEGWAEASLLAHNQPLHFPKNMVQSLRKG